MPEQPSISVDDYTNMLHDQYLGMIKGLTEDVVKLRAVNQVSAETIEALNEEVASLRSTSA